MAEGREQLLLEELTSVSWGIILTETWRKEAEEIWRSSGHVFAGAGGTAGKCGVAIIIHR